MSLDQGASMFKRKRASVATDDEVKQHVVKTKKHASSSSGLKHLNRQLEKMDQIPHTGSKAVIKNNQVCGNIRMRWRRYVVFIPLECENNQERGRDPEQCSALQRGVGGEGGGGDVKPMLGLIISLGINKKVLATHLLVS